MPNYEEIIEQSQFNVKALGEKLKDLEGLYQEIKALKTAAEGIPEKFDNKFQELARLSSDYTNTLGVATKTYLDGNNTAFVMRLSELCATIQKLEQEITRLLNTDLTILFKNLQKEFIEQTKNDLAVELKKIDDKSKDLQSKINELKVQVDRLERVDLDKHFDKLQKTLAEIFGAINAINLNLTQIIQNLTGVAHSLGTIQTAIDTTHKETKHFLISFSETTDKHLSLQDSQAKRNIELIEEKMTLLSEQYGLIQKQTKTNGIIQVIGLAIVLSLLIYIAMKS